MMPYTPSSYVADMSKTLAESLHGKSIEVRNFMPKWGTINERRGQLHEVIRLSGLNININELDHSLLIKVASLPTSRIQVYFIDNEDYFTHRKSYVDEDGKPYGDNDERLVFFARGVLETVKKLRWTPDMIVCQGWMTSLIPFYYKKHYSKDTELANVKMLTTVYNQEIPNNIGSRLKQSVGFRKIGANDLKAYKDDVDYTELVKIAVDYSDALMLAEDVDNAELMSHIQ